MHKTKIAGRALTGCVERKVFQSYFVMVNKKFRLSILLWRLIDDDDLIRQNGLFLQLLQDRDQIRIAVHGWNQYRYFSMLILNAGISPLAMIPW